MAASLTDCSLTGSLTSETTYLYIENTFFSPQLFTNHTPVYLEVDEPKRGAETVFRASLLVDTHSLAEDQLVIAPIAACDMRDISQVQCGTLLIDMWQQLMTDTVFYKEIMPQLHPSVRICTMYVDEDGEAPEPMNYLRFGENWIRLEDIPPDDLPRLDAISYMPCFDHLIENGLVGQLFVEKTYQYDPPNGYMLTHKLPNGSVYRRRSMAKSARVGVSS